MRQPRKPREPRESREGADAAPGAIPPPGFFVPVRGFHYGASGGGPQPPRRIGAPGAVAAVPAGPAPMGAPPAPAPEYVHEPPAGPAIAAASTNAFAERTQERGYWESRSTRRAQPQGETQLVHAWLHVLTVRKIPPHACTIWLTRVEPQPTYDQYIPGDAVLGEHPDRSLYEYANTNRRQRDVAERFVGRIRAPAADGSPIELGGGELYLPPAPAVAPGPSWSQPGAAPGGWPGGPPPYGGGPPWSPPGAMPWWMMGAPPGGGMPPWWGPSASPLSAILAASQPQTPPPAVVQQDPAAMRAWQMMSDNQSMLLRHVLEVSARPPAASPAAAEQPDLWTTLERVVGVVDKLRGPQHEPEQRPGITVMRLDDDTTLVTDKNGDINSGATAWANMKGLKGIAQSLRAMKTPSGAAGGGPQPPRRAGLPAPNGAAKPNGTLS